MRRFLCASAGRFVFLLLSLCLVDGMPAAVYTLTLNVTGSGVVSRNPTNSVYPDGAVVTLTATPSAGWLFAGWAGDASGAANPLNVAMTTNKVITANFHEIPAYTLSVAADGQGSITLDPPGGTFLSNAVVSVSATPSAGWVFAHWTGDASGSANPLSVNLRANKSMTAVFAQLPAIDVQPQNASAEVGGTARFTVHAVGAAPLAYQWYFNGSLLAGEDDPTLELNNVHPTQAGEYWVVVSNANGAAASARATLAVRDDCTGTNVVSTCTEAALRAAMSAGGLVRLCCNGTITLSNTIEVTRDVALDARDRNVVISGNNAVRLFSVSPGVRFSITNLVLANGRHVGAKGAPGQPGLPGQGGAVFNDGGIVEIASSILTNNQAFGGQGGDNPSSSTLTAGGEARGGAISARSGQVRLHRVELSQNAAVGGHGGNPAFFAAGQGGDGVGGAVCGTNAVVEVVECRVNGNTSAAPSGGTADTGPAASARGGAFFLASGSLLISNCNVSWNVASGSNGPLGRGILIPAASAYGGAIAALSGRVSVEQSRFASNAAHGGNATYGSGEGQGGVIYSSATLLARDSSFFGNQAISGGGSSFNPDGSGGAVHNNGSAILERCSLYLNSAIGGVARSFISTGYPAGHGMGGAIFNAAQLALTNCSIALNSARGGDEVPSIIAPGFPGSGLGGGFFNATGLAIVINATIASNSVMPGVSYDTSRGTTAGANIANSNGTFTLRNSLIAYGGTNGNAWGVITDSGFNISSDGSANLNSGSSFNFTDPRLGPLGNYGGPTLTMALRPSSPAIDFGGAGGAPSVDQRGFSRPFGVGVDIGAYEFHSNQTELPRLSISLAPGGVILGFEAIAGTEYHLQASETASSPWTVLEIIGPFVNPSAVTRTISISSNGNSHRFFRVKMP